MLSVAAFISFLVLIVDALEWETNGNCEHCLLMPYLTERAIQPNGERMEIEDIIKQLEEETLLEELNF
jgi:hypothetical protein